MGIAALELGKLLLGVICHGVGQGGNGQGHEHFVGVQAGILVAKILRLQPADRLQHLLADEFKPVADAAKSLECIEQHGGHRAQRLGGAARNDPAVMEQQGACRSAGGLCFFVGCIHHGAVFHGGLGLLHHKLQLFNRLVRCLALKTLHAGSIIPADDLLAGGGAADIVIHDAVARHVNTHIRGRLVGALTLDLLEDRAEDGEDLHIPVVVHGDITVSLQMEGVDHIHIVQVRGGGLIGQVHRMLEGQVPDGERFKLGIAGSNAPLIIMVQLGKAGGHFAAAGTGGRDHHQRVAGFNIVIVAKAFIAHHIGHVGGIARNGIMAVAADAKGRQALQKGVRPGLSRITGDHDAAHIQIQTAENVDQAQHIILIGDAKVAADLVLLNVGRGDGDHDLHIVLELLEHTDLAVRLKARQNTGSMVIIKQLAAEFQIQLAAELGNALADLFGLGGQVFLIVKTDGIHFSHYPFCSITKSKLVYHTPSRLGRL